MIDTELKERLGQCRTKAERQALIREAMTTVDGRTKADLAEGRPAARQEAASPALRATLATAEASARAEGGSVGRMLPASQVQELIRKAVAEALDRSLGRANSLITGLLEQVSELEERLGRLEDLTRSDAGRALALLRDEDEAGPEDLELPLDDPADREGDPLASGEVSTGQEAGTKKEEVPLKCSHCDFTAASDAGLKAHVRAKHPA